MLFSDRDATPFLPRAVLLPRPGQSSKPSHQRCILIRKEQTASSIEPSVHGHVTFLTGLKHLRWWCGWHLHTD